MHRLVLLLSLLVFGCGSVTGGSELEREVVSRHLGGDFGTVGPFSRQRKQELDVLAPADRQQALAQLEHGAVGFLIYGPGSEKPQRIVVVLKDQVVGDYRVP